MTSIIYFLCIGLLYPVLVQGKATFADCGGKQKSITIKDGSVKPDPVQYPGVINMTVTVEVSKVLEAPQLEIQLIKEGDPLPCFSGFGSCTYDVCEMIEKYKSRFCPMFPDPEKCGCPIEPGTYSVKDASVTLPDFDLPTDIAQMLTVGPYKAIIELKDSNDEYGCIATAFEMVPST